MILSGHIESRDYKKEEIIEGLRVIRFDWQKKSLSVGTLTHLATSGNWYFLREDTVQGEEIMELDRLAYPVFVPFPTDGPEVKIKYHQWMPIIRNDELDKGVIVEAKISPTPFYSGHSALQCRLCSNDFEGYPKQKLCKECCEKQSVALLIPKKRFHLAATTRKDLYNRSDMCKLVEEFTREMGMDQSVFPVWLTRKEQQKTEEDEEGKS